MGINRNIVECKEKNKKHQAQPPESINRNIVECKDELPAGMKWAEFVLIETLWNVKVDLIFVTPYCDTY